MALLGYARVSTLDQHLTGQLEALKAAGAETIYRGKISGARADRPQLAKLMASLKPGDVVLITKLDRLGRSTRELLDLIERIGKAGAAFRSLGDPLWDTSSSQGRLLSTLLAAIAEFERDLIRERTGEGRKRALANGVKFGRPAKLSPYQARGGPQAPGRRRDLGRDRQVICCRRLDDLAVALRIMTAPPDQLALRPTVIAGERLGRLCRDPGRYQNRPDFQE
jgi:DNA invertase Pin-like site-specific DNA recombinase